LAGSDDEDRKGYSSRKSTPGYCLTEKVEEGVKGNEEGTGGGMIDWLHDGR
jgi:hypothetical protein